MMSDTVKVLDSEMCKECVNGIARVLEDKELQKVKRERDEAVELINRIEDRLGKGWVKELAGALLTVEENLNKIGDV